MPVARRTGPDMDELRVCSLYPDRLNVYGDRGNLLVLANRCARRGIGWTLTEAGTGDPVDPEAHDLIYLGGGQDRDQRLCGQDLLDTKREGLAEAADRGAVILAICGGFQMLGDSYEVEGERMPGLGIVSACTERRAGPRLIGPVAIEVDLDGEARLLAGFENHGGRTYLGEGERALGRVLRGHGNNGGDGLEGVWRGNVVGSYLHGPLLASNAWLADWVIARALGREDLAPLEDGAEDAAHTSARKAAAAPNPARPTPAGASLFREVWLGARLGDNLDSVYFGEEGRDPAALLSPAPTVSLSYTKLGIARAAGRVSRAGCRGAGTSAPGRMLLASVPDAIGRLAERLEGGATLVAGTNGKTTTARMLATVLRTDGRTVVHNRAGANTHWGVATALIDQQGEQGVFEVDEAWLPLIAAQLRPRMLVLLNLSRDRLDCYGEIERVATIWARLIAADPDLALVVNADDPRLVALVEEARGTTHGGVTYFGIEDPSAGGPPSRRPADRPACSRCGRDLVYTRAFMGHLGHYGCAECGTSRPPPDVAAVSVRAAPHGGSRVRVSAPVGSLDLRLPMPGLFNVHNALAALAAGARLGLSPEPLRGGLETVQTPFGRAESLQVQGRTVQIWLMKNPVGADAIIETIRPPGDAPPLQLWVALNDREPDGRDVSWIWDVDFEALADHVANVMCTGRRAAELALRLRCAGWPVRATDVDEDVARSFDRATARAADRLLALPTYTALLELQAVLADRGVASRDWGGVRAVPRLSAHEGATPRA